MTFLRSSVLFKNGTLMKFYDKHPAEGAGLLCCRNGGERREWHGFIPAPRQMPASEGKKQTKAAHEQCASSKESTH